MNEITYGDVRLAFTENRRTHFRNRVNHIPELAITKICTGKFSEDKCLEYSRLPEEYREEILEWIFVDTNFCGIELNYRKFGDNGFGERVVLFDNSILTGNAIARACVHIINDLTEEIELVREGA